MSKYVQRSSEQSPVDGPTLALQVSSSRYNRMLTNAATYLFTIGALVSWRVAPEADLENIFLGAALGSLALSRVQKIQNRSRVIRLEQAAVVEYNSSVLRGVRPSSWSIPVVERVMATEPIAPDLPDIIPADIMQLPEKPIIDVRTKQRAIDPTDY